MAARRPRSHLTLLGAALPEGGPAEPERRGHAFKVDWHSAIAKLAGLAPISHRSRTDLAPISHRSHTDLATPLLALRRSSAPLLDSPRTACSLLLTTPHLPPRYPEELDASVLMRLPCRTSTDDRYFGDDYQVHPLIPPTCMPPAAIPL